MITHLSASLRARLKQRADASREDFELVLTRFGLERLLYRLSISPHSTQFQLKDALVFALWFNHPHRPTRDADLLGFGPADVNRLTLIFREIISIKLEDGLVFDVRSVRATPIREEARYGGIRVEVNATLDRARIKLQIDVGFGDAVTPAATEVNYPVLLADFPAPRLMVYPRETVCAEKLEAIVQLGISNSRMKDYFDLFILSRENAMDSVILTQAIAATFQRRKTPVPGHIPLGLTAEFGSDPLKQTQWRAFLGRNRLTAPDLPVVVAELALFFSQPLITARTTVIL